jgi:hypothetical protein
MRRSHVALLVAAALAVFMFRVTCEPEPSPGQTKAER